MVSILLLLEDLCGMICENGSLIVLGWCLAILILCFLKQTNTTMKLSLRMKPQTLETVALILVFMISIKQASL